jgi:putative copper export protein
VLGKAGAFALLMVLATYNKWRFGPRLLRGDSAAALGLQRAVTAEWLLIALVLVATAVMTSLYSPEHLEGSFAPEHEPVVTH